MQNSLKLMIFFFLICAVAATVTAQKSSTSQKPNAVTIINRAKFRVTLNGFTVNRQTADHAFDADGKSDEVFFLIKVAEFEKLNNQSESRVRFLPLRASRIMGDTNNQNGRVQAGSASNRGGLRTGDRFPSQEPWVRTENPKVDMLPMLLWEGELAKGEFWVTIVPTIWEWDNGNQNLRARWNSNTEYWLDSRKHDPERTYGAPTQLLESFQLLGYAGVSRNVTQHIFGAAEDRPIGMENDRGNDVFDPTWLTLSFENALRAVNESPTGKGKGIVEINYADKDALQGDYTIYLQIERVP